MRSIAIALSTLVAAAAAAANNYTFPAGFNIALVSSTDKASWCLAERNTCPSICGGIADRNSCDSDTLEFSCVCSNGTEADVSPYMQTIPFFVCQETYKQCIAASSTQDQDEKCTAAQKECGTLNATASSTSSSTTTSSAISTATESATGNQAESTATATATASSSATTETSNAAIRLVGEHATGVMATVLFFAARLLL
ncbi:hypothetical protein KXW98_002582 [Aspergillus fumigatus]|jgi:cobalamin biosynthesis Mg chelatase CobN|uniref:DUF7707 domain-containing protein n=1 Tax=Aspergillus fumigatus TaxID=746128 RepID=A0A229WAE9_ASPFM|nr:hypothetical protein CNMCM8714_004446 [Aspergillus fumigatus]KMK55997.1 hypothetical protein Y699_08418 [Aspergillus fumigatus Z5]KAF4255680.1 hypothetical protein CNMCM8057_004506 [Aspergillus fumigatus]KAF4263243.1 hypothetical protein CNMCM8812_004235 [Aspergillus fumigatus]KAF4280530.1 hypothetical protein CNMCM8689_001952 [Aspergillus fumigatus]